MFYVLISYEIKVQNTNMTRSVLLENNFFFILFNFLSVSLNHEEIGYCKILSVLLYNYNLYNLTDLP